MVAVSYDGHIQVVPYLFRLALTDRQLYWRLAISLAFMVTSKAAGKSHS